MNNSVAAWKYFKLQSEWKAYLQDLVTNNDVALLRSIIVIDNQQTELERKNKESTEDNNVGWTKHDAKEMGELADKVRSGVQLSEGEMAKSRNKMKKYWKQLMLVSKEQQSVKREKQEQQVRKQKELQFKEYTEALRQCSENGKQCEYGICDECPVTQGLQMRMQFGEC